jgi:hypothetical protein
MRLAQWTRNDHALCICARYVSASRCADNGGMRPGGKHRWGKLSGLAAVCDHGRNTGRSAEACVRCNQSRTVPWTARTDLSVPGDYSSLLGLPFFFNRI